jgi:hypothetical protein
MAHHFHIPVMGLAFTIDTPLKVARYGIDSVISIGSDDLVEDMRAYYCRQHGRQFAPIPKKAEDARARRITSYLNLVDQLVKEQIAEVRQASLDRKSELTKYLDMQPPASSLHQWYQTYLATNDPGLKTTLDTRIRKNITAGSIDANIMTKLNKPNVDENGHQLGPEYADALAALRGYANSTLHSSIVFSAGFNPRLFGYLDQFADFFPNAHGQLKKKVVLKVSDYRSALIQGKYLAKKGIWISEFRIESGLNCGGHAFPTEGLLLGPILEAFRENRENLQSELYGLCRAVWQDRPHTNIPPPPPTAITVQGGVGTAGEHIFLRSHYGVERTGWGTPFLLVPEATTVDDATLEQLIAARKEDLYLSQSSPLGVPFNNLRHSAS